MHLVCQLVKLQFCSVWLRNSSAVSAVPCQTHLDWEQCLPGALANPVDQAVQDHLEALSVLLSPLAHAALSDQPHPAALEHLFIPVGPVDLYLPSDPCFPPCPFALAAPSTQNHHGPPSYPAIQCLPLVLLVLYFLSLLAFLLVPLDQELHEYEQWTPALQLGWKSTQCYYAAETRLWAMHTESRPWAISAWRWSCCPCFSAIYLVLNAKMSYIYLGDLWQFFGRCVCTRACFILYTKIWNVS